ncbi:hypothetical protein M1271_03490 [Patescibacteria group bacterium]|nr:hypothetical protein [Patescibacteria group bacterium]MCL5797843.1 hypothetical protein [Patescibacteria group bacterium]
MKCKIVSAKESRVFDNVLSIVIPNTAQGQIQILPQHAESFILLNEGEMTIEKVSGESQEFEINQGLCHIRDDTVTVVF